MTKTIIKRSCHVEQCWLLTGRSVSKLWWARRRYLSDGSPASVRFDYERVMRREDLRHDVIGFMHTHPGMSAMFSERDFRTMGAWVNCLGRPLVCVIKGVDGLRGFWFDDDELDPVECELRRFWNLLVGTTELEV